MTIDELLKQQFGSAEEYVAKLASAPVDPMFGDGDGFSDLATAEMGKTAGAGISTEEVLKLATLCDLAGDQLAKTAGEAVAVPDAPAGGTDNPKVVEPENGTQATNTSGAQTVSLPPKDTLVNKTDTPNTGTTLTPPGDGAKMKLGQVDAEALRIFQILKQAASEMTTSEGEVPNTATNPGLEGRGLPAEAKKIDTPQKAQDLTPRDAAQQEKEDLKGVLDEPAMSAKTDPVLKNNFDHEADAGPKIAAAREYLEKVAEEGCTCGGQGTCTYCQIKEALALNFSGIDEGEGAAPPAEGDEVSAPQTGPAAATQAIRF